MRTVPPVKAVPPCSVSTLAESVVLSGWADKNKAFCCVFLYLLSKLLFLLHYSSIEARRFPRNRCVFFIGQMEKQGASADILLTWN